MTTDLPTGVGTLITDPRPANILYRRRGVVVTTDFVLSDGGYYEVAGLSDITEVRGPVHAGIIVGGITALTEAVLLLPFVGSMSRPLGILVATVALVIPVLVGLLCARFRRTRMELLARYRGYRVALFSTRDRADYGQMVKALRRARQHHGL